MLLDWNCMIRLFIYQQPRWKLFSAVSVKATKNRNVLNSDSNFNLYTPRNIFLSFLNLYPDQTFKLRNFKTVIIMWIFCRNNENEAIQFEKSFFPQLIVRWSECRNVKTNLKYPLTSTIKDKTFRLLLKIYTYWGKQR